jgi:hypothetical protein
VACLQYTGGTTGVGKGAMPTHRNLLTNVAQFVGFRGDDMRESDHVLTALPLYHIFAFTANLLGSSPDVPGHNVGGLQRRRERGRPDCGYSGRFCPGGRRVCVAAATSSTRRGRRRGLFNMLPFLKCGCGGSWSPSCGHAWACLTLGSFLQSVGPGRPVTLGATVVLPKRFSPRLCVRGKRNRGCLQQHAPTPDAQTGKVLENASESRNPD